MYNGELVTFKIKDKESLSCISLLDIDTDLTEKGLLIKNKNTQEEIGYFEDVWGIDFEQMMLFLGYTYK